MNEQQGVIRHSKGKVSNQSEKVGQKGIGWTERVWNTYEISRKW